MKLGAIDVLQTPVDAAELLGTARRAIQICRRSYQQRTEAEEFRRRLETLTEREVGMLHLVVNGNPTNKLPRTWAFRSRPWPSTPPTWPV
jgi:FixJ family two-component response regulator